MKIETDTSSKTALYQRQDGSFCAAVLSAKDQPYRVMKNPKVTDTEAKKSVTGEVIQDQSWGTLKAFEKDNCPNSRRIF